MAGVGFHRARIDRRIGRIGGRFFDQESSSKRLTVKIEEANLMRLMLITADPGLAKLASESGVDRVFVDLEIMGKVERQGHKDTVISRHSLDDVKRVREVVKAGGLLVRVNPWHDRSEEEVEAVIAAGADSVMLPMFKGADEVKAFSKCVGSRAASVGLLETSEALARVEEIAIEGGLHEVHIGLNDLHLALGLDFLFEVLASGMVDMAATKIRRGGLPFGIGGVARVGSGELPASLVLGEHERLGSTGVILSRAFTAGAKSLEDLPAGLDLGREVSLVREEMERLKGRTEEEREADRLALGLICRKIALDWRGRN